MVTDIRPGLVSAAGWTIPTQTVIWAAGNTASPVLRCLGAPLDRVGRAIVEPDCTIPGHPEVFVLGDAAAFDHQQGGTLPGLCPVAIQMGEYAARTIRGDLAGRPRQPFNYWDKGQLAVIGRGQAVADIGKLHFGGFIAWLAWIFVHIFFLIGFRNRVLVLLEWAWSYITYSRGARLITGETCIRPARRSSNVRPPTRDPRRRRSRRAPPSSDSWPAASPTRARRRMATGWTRGSPRAMRAPCATSTARPSGGRTRASTCPTRSPSWCCWRTTTRPTPRRTCEPPRVAKYARGEDYHRVTLARLDVSAGSCASTGPRWRTPTSTTARFPSASWPSAPASAGSARTPC